MSPFLTLHAAPLLASRLTELIERSRLAWQHPHSGLILRSLLVLVSASVGIYLMLPRGQAAGRRRERYIGGALVTLALVLMATVQISPGPSEGQAGFPAQATVPGTQAKLLWSLDDQPFPTCWTFHLLAVVSLASAVMMITTRNPVYSALWFAMVLLGNSGLYLLQGAEFLSAATIIVYAGAIVVTFLFVIMLAQPSGAARYDRLSREPLLSTLSGLILATALVGTLHHASRLELRGGTGDASRLPSAELIAAGSQLPDGRQIHNVDQHTLGLGKSLFLDHVVSVEVIGVILLVAVVGAMLIAGHRIEPGKETPG